MNQTAIEWLIENSHIIPKNELNKRELIKQAKEMEKEHIKNAHTIGVNQGLYGFKSSEEFFNRIYKNK